MFSAHNISLNFLKNRAEFHNAVSTVFTRDAIRQVKIGMNYVGIDCEYASDGQL